MKSFAGLFDRAYQVLFVPRNVSKETRKKEIIANHHKFFSFQTRVEVDLILLEKELIKIRLKLIWNRLEIDWDFIFSIKINFKLILIDFSPKLRADQGLKNTQKQLNV